MRDYVYDLETYPNVFTMAVEHAEAPLRWYFEISDWRNDSRDILQYLKDTNARMVGFNNIGFDYPVLHTLIRMGKSDAATLYQKAQAIIGSQSDEEGDKWAHQVNPSDRFVEQLDLFKIHHFDNKARATSLKVLEFNMRSDSIEDLPFPVGTVLTREQIEVLKQYNKHDVAQTKAFYHHTLDMIHFREELTRKYARDFMNHNDTKIGKDYFTMKLEEAGVACYDFGPSGRTPRQTKRPVIHLKDAILPWINFEHPEFNRVMNWLKAQTITETKGVFTDLTATVNGFTFVFGLGGIQGSLHRDLQLVPAVDLGPAGEARADLVDTILLPLFHQIELIPQRGPGANDGHFAGEDVHQLGQLVQTGLPQEAAHRGDVPLGIFQQMGGRVVGGIHPHGAEFQHFKGLLILSDPVLAEKHRARVPQLDHQGDDPHGQRQQDQHDEADQKIQGRFDGIIDPLPQGQLVGGMVHGRSPYSSL